MFLFVQLLFVDSSIYMHLSFPNVQLQIRAFNFFVFFGICRSTQLIGGVVFSLISVHIFGYLTHVQLLQHALISLSIYKIHSSSYAFFICAIVPFAVRPRLVTRKN